MSKALSGRTRNPMSQSREDDAPDHAADDPNDTDAVEPEAGEGPFPPVAGEPRPTIGN